MQKLNTRLSQFDGLRGLAALLVFISHMLCTFYPAVISGIKSEARSDMELFIFNSPFNILCNGEFAVCIFFAISGYVLSYAYLNHFNKKKVIAASFKRYPRLMLLVWLSALLSFVIYHSFGYFTTETAAITGSSWLKNLFIVDYGFTDLLKNIGYEQFLKHNTPTPSNPVLWTIATELKGSLLVFAILLISPKSKLRFLIYLIFFVYYFNGYFMLFIFGLTLADYSINIRNSIKSHYLSWLIITSLAILLGSYKQDGNFAPWRLFDFIQVFTKPNFIGAILLLFMVCYQQHLKTLLSNKIFNWLGRISYSLYLFHLILLAALALPIFLFVYSYTQHYYLSVFTALILSVPVIFLLCSNIFTRIDEWCIKWCNTFGNWVYKRINVI